MEKILVTYTMNKSGEMAETCITLPMSTDNALELLAFQDKSITLERHIQPLLNQLTMLQGYSTNRFLTAELATGAMRSRTVGNIHTHDRPKRPRVWPRT